MNNLKNIFGNTDIKFTDKSWNDFCGRIISLSENIAEYKEEGQAAQELFSVLFNIDFQPHIFEKMTNSMASSLVRNCADILISNGYKTNYIIGAIIEKDKLYAFVFDSSITELNSFFVRIPDYEDSHYGYLIKKAWITNSLKQYAESNNSIIINKLTDFLCF